MNIIVVLRPILDPAGFIVNRKAQKVFVNRENYLLNPADKNALEAALRLSGAVTAISLGGAPAEGALRQARALGASRAVLVREAALESAEASVMTTVLQRLVSHLGRPELVVLGAEVVDADLAQVGPRLALALGWPFLEGAHEILVQGRVARAITRHTDGFHQIEADLPAVVSVGRDSNKPRYPPGASLVNVYRANDAVEILTAADLGLSEADLAPLTERRGESFPPEREWGKGVEGSPDEIAEQLRDVIRKS
jgi:electron transfer flavoprotein beta subunit